MPSFKVRDIVQVGNNGEKGRIIEVFRPLGTYCLYKVHMMGSGNVTTAAQHELIKGLPDHDFHDLFDCLQPSATNEPHLQTINESDLYSALPLAMDEHCMLPQNPPSTNHTTSTWSTNIK